MLKPFMEQGNERLPKTRKRKLMLNKSGRRTGVTNAWVWTIRTNQELKDESL
jgi:hypothetical protein